MFSHSIAILNLQLHCQGLMHSVNDDANLQRNDPAPDLMDFTPDGKYLMVAFRGPKPVSTDHAAQGSCPGVGIIEVSDEGNTGKLIDVLRTTNTIDTAPVGIILGGHSYKGLERSDVHAATVVKKVKSVKPKSRKV